MFCKDSLVGELRDTQEVLSTRSIPSSIPKINIATNFTNICLQKNSSFQYWRCVPHSHSDDTTVHRLTFASFGNSLIELDSH